MSRKRRVVPDVDGTPVDTGEDDYTPTVDVPQKPLLPAKRVVIWTRKGEDHGAFSEHGQHEEGDEVETDHADILIRHGFAEEAD